MSPEPQATSPEPQATALTPLQGDAARRLTAQQAVERLRLWRPSPSPDLGSRPDPGPTQRPRVFPRPDPGPSTQRPRVFLNMVCTADGRATLGGRSGPIGNRADRELFHALRTAVDAVLVGAGTARAERYGRLVREESHRRLRRERGLEEEPLACVASAGLSLPGVPLLAAPGARVAILTPSSTGELHPSPAPPPAGASIEYVRCARDGLLDLPAALGELRARLGVGTLLCEGGPHLNGELFAAGLVDELFLTLAPKLAGGGEPTPLAPKLAGGGEPTRIVHGPDLDPPVELELLDVLESESNLLLRYRVGGAG
jgi:riboflavin biosynthesis pyrimidine reductase